MLPWRTVHLANISSALTSWIYPKTYSQLSQDLLPLSESLNPTRCLDHTISTTLEQVIDCLDAYTVSQGRYNATTYAASQPNDTERSAWRSTISSLLSVDGPCNSISLPPALNDIYTISQFIEPSGASYCVFLEVHGEGLQYGKGWGLFVVPATRAAVSRHIHVSAPHPAYDLDTPQQAAALFKSTGAKSLLIAGRSRLAFKEPSDCGVSSTLTDPSHNRLEPFYDATRSSYAWQMANGGCPPATCAFIQFHGKGVSTCRTDQIFLSSGLGNGASSVAWYTDATPRPIKQLQTHLQRAFPAWNISLPSSSTCSLTATKNVVGRFLNGIDDGRVCTDASNATLATGFFVHVEQAAGARVPAAYGAWTEALIGAFGVV